MPAAKRKIPVSVLQYDVLLVHEQDRSTPATEREGMTGQLLYKLQAMNCLTNLSSWRGTTKYSEGISVTSHRQGTEQPGGVLSLGGKLDRRRRLCELRTERAKGGAEIHGKIAEAYGHILKREYFNFHNKKCRHRLNSTNP